MPKAAAAVKRRDTGDGSLYQRASDGMWVGAVDIPTTNGKRKRATIARANYKDASQALRKLVREVEDGTFAASGNTTLEQWGNRWVDTIVKPRVRPNTHDYYETTLRIHVIPHIGTVRLSKLTPQHVRDLIATVQESSTRNAVAAHQVLQKCLKDATREGLVARNVADLVDKPKHMPQSRGALTADQARAIINTAVDRGDPLASRWACAFYTGARPGELLGLQWDRVDLETGTVELSWQLQHVKKSHGCPKDDPCGKRPGWCPRGKWKLPAGFEYVDLQGSLLLTRPKTSAGVRVVPLARPALAMLRAHRTTTMDDYNPHNLVWHHDGNPIHAREERRSWADLCAAAGIVDRPVERQRESWMTTQEIADVLFVSRPTVVKWLGEGLIRSYRTGRWRHIKVADFLASTPALTAKLTVDDIPQVALQRDRPGAPRRQGGEWEVRPPAPYVSRHTTATLLQAAGVPEDLRMAIMGHSSIVAHRGYLHTDMGVKRGAVAALEAAFADD